MRSAPDQVILQGTTATLRVVHLDGDGEPADAAGTVTVTVTDSAGAAVVTAASTTKPEDTTGIYTVELTPAQTADLDRLTATWADAGDSSTFSTTIDVVGRHWCSVAELRALRNLDSATKFPDEALRAARDWVTWQIEDICGQAFVPRFAFDTVSGTGGSDLLVTKPTVRAVRRVTVTDLDGTTTSYDPTDVHIEDGGWLHLPGGWPRGHHNVTVAYTHGLDRPHPDLRTRAMHYIREQSLEDRQGRNVLSVIDPTGTLTRFASPGGRRRPTGDLELDEVIMRYDRSRIIGGTV